MLSQKIIIATAILFNISRMWRDDGLDDDDDDSDSDGEHDDDERQEPVRVEDNDLASVRVGARWKGKD